MLGELHQLSRKQAVGRAVELLDEFSLTDAADRVVSGYSGGMRRRLDLAATLVARPEVLFLDEPTTGLDPRARSELWDVLDTLVDRGTTLLLTTQYLEEAERLADDIIVIDRGHIIARGDAARSSARSAATTSTSSSSTRASRRGGGDRRRVHRHRARSSTPRPDPSTPRPTGGVDALIAVATHLRDCRDRRRRPEHPPAHARRRVPHPHRRDLPTTTSDEEDPK